MDRPCSVFFLRLHRGSEDKRGLLEKMAAWCGVSSEYPDMAAARHPSLTYTEK